MALTACKDCGKSMSKNAKQCPACGAPAPKKTGIVAGTFAALLLGSIIYGIAQSTFNPAPPPPPKTAAELQKETEFQDVVATLKALRSQMKNPASFQLENAFKTAAGDLCIMYRGTNSFNAVVSNHLVVKDGKPSDTADQWNRRCAGKTGESYSHARFAM